MGAVGKKRQGATPGPLLLALLALILLHQPRLAAYLSASPVGAVASNESYIRLGQLTLTSFHPLKPAQAAFTQLGVDPKFSLKPLPGYSSTLRNSLSIVGHLHSQTEV